MSPSLPEFPGLRQSTLFLGFLAMGALLVGLMPVYSGLSASGMQAGRDMRARMVAQYGLSDLCLFTEARYTRHPSGADLNTAFQDHPVSLGHFPSGSLIGPPQHLMRPMYMQALEARKKESNGSP